MKARIPQFLLLMILLPSGDVAAQEKFSLSMFHFNVQYVAGGLKGFPSGTDTNPTFDLDDAEVQDAIIVESFEPILDLFLAHPDWKVTLEMQAYMAEVMHERHPGILSKLKQLVSNGQVELVSFHYSDQMFLAYPKLDMERSHQLMERVWEEVGFSPSEVVFCQEGQFGEGVVPFAAAHDRTILVLPKNLFRYQHLADYEQAAPLYELDGVDIVIGSRGFATPEVEVQWNFFDDGELLATGGNAPYTISGFVKNQQALDEYEQQLTEAAAAGFRIASTDEYVAWAKANQLDQPALLPILDGTWQPPSTNSMRRWLGGSGVVDMAFACERDNQVTTSNVRARHWILVAETLVTHAEKAEKIEPGTYQDTLLDCWRTALLGQVTDASGINPFINEVNYGLDHAASAQACAEAVINEVAPQVGGPVLKVDTDTGEVFELDDFPSSLLSPRAPYFTTQDGFEVTAPGRETQVTWESGASQGLTRVEIEATEPANGERTLEAVFPMNLDGFFVTPGLVEEEVKFYPLNSFDFQEGRISLPVANGLVGIGTDLWLIKQTSMVHIAATFEAGDGKVRFIDDTLDPEGSVNWVFWILEGNQNDAAAFARQLNLSPMAYLETGQDPDRGCGCHPTPPADYSLLLLMLFLGITVRRRTA
jgi:hypothetical protein